MNTTNYPLEELVKIKKKRFERSIKIVKEKTIILQREKDILKKVEDKRNKVFKHKEDKLEQLRASLDEGERTDKIREKKTYLKVVKEDLLLHDKKVKDQEKSVSEAENDLEAAKKDLLAKQKDVEKLKIHKKSWEKEMKYVEAQKEQIIQDEIGSVRHIIRKKQQKK